MGGEIGVKSQPGKGSDFHFTANFGVAAPGPAVRRPMAPPKLSALRILVIDDSQNSREIMHGLLVSLGYQPALASSARAGLAELQRPSTGVPYDLVLLDWKMPDMDGFAVVEALRASQALPHLPRIVMVTAYGDDALIHRAAAERLDGCIAKPVSASALLDAIVSAFGAAAEDDGRRSGGAVAPLAAPASLKGRRVLLVEDNEFNQIVASELLGDVAGMRVTIARNGQEAVDCILAEPFDAVLMDVQMPVMDGYTATRLIREWEREQGTPARPILALTAHALAEDEEKSLAVGMNDHVTKPFEPTQLFAALSNWMPPEKTGSGDAISFDLGLQRCLGRTDLYVKLLERFVSTHSGDPSEIAAALDADEPDRAAGLVHNVISTAGTIGAEGLSEAARELQLAIDEGEATRWPELLDVFAHHHAVVSLQLRAYLAERPATSR
jgi:CheY-like chemotaxis protein/HPt (histidine-containing phosphotransfer) domain-containing protein